MIIETNTENSTEVGNSTVDNSKDPKESRKKKAEQYGHEVVKRVNNQTGRKFQILKCTFPGCGAEFSKSWNLVDHARSHTGERPFACDLCPMKFTQKGNLNKHRKLHFKGEANSRKNHKCPHCDKSYTEKFNLTVSLQ